MVRTEKTKVAALSYVVLAGLLFLLPVPAEKVGVCAGCSLWVRLVYPFFHANLLHYIVNCWALLSVVFIYDIAPSRLLACYVAAVLVPVGLLGLHVPTVGFSGVLYALFGSLSFSVRKKWLWQLWWAAFIALGFTAVATNGWIHLWCYAIGIIIAVLNLEVPIK